MIEQLKDKDQYDAFLSGNKVVVIDFMAQWCQPCLAMAPAYNELSEMEAFSSVKFAKVDADENEEAMEAAEVEGLPTIKIFVDGKEVASFMGGCKIPELKEALPKHL